MPRFLHIIVLLLAFFTVSVRAEEQGKASFYGKWAIGKKTASGHIITKDCLIAAHRTYPFGTMLKVTNLSNDRSVVVRVEDRGPFIKGRIIDLSNKAAQQLDFMRQGIATVQIEVLGIDHNQSIAHNRYEEFYPELNYEAYQPKQNYKTDFLLEPILPRDFELEAEALRVDYPMEFSFHDDEDY